MNKAFIFPSDYFNPNTADEFYIQQSSIIAQNGFKCIYIDIDNLHTLKFLPYDLTNQIIIYRGWMLNKDNYSNLEQLVSDANGKMFISTETYLLAHYLQEWYPILKDLTADTIIFAYKTDVNIDLSNLKWDNFL